MERSTGPARVNVLSVGVSAIDPTQALQAIESWVARREPHYVCVSGVHGVMECQRDPQLRDIHNHAGLVTPDRMPLVWLSRLHGHANEQLVWDVLLQAAGLRHYELRADRDPGRATLFGQGS